MVSTPSTTRPDYFYAQAAVQNGAPEVRMDMGNGEYILFRRSGSPPPDGIRYFVVTEHGYPDGYTINYDYPDLSEYPNVVRDSFGRQIQLTWVEAERTTMTDLSGYRLYKVLEQAVLPDGSKLNYTYGFGLDGVRSRVKDRLEGVAHVNAANSLLWGRSYLYENSSFSYALTGKVDQLGRRISTYAYDSAGLASSTELAGGVDKYTVVNLEESGGLSTYRQVTNPLGRREDYEFRFGRSPSDYGFVTPIQLKRVDGHQTASVPATSKTYLSSGWNGDYALHGGTNERQVSFSLANDGLLRPYSIVEALGTTEARTTGVAWHPALDLPTQVVKPGLTTTYTYEGLGRVKTRTETDTTTTSVPYATAGQSRTWTYDWSSAGRLLSVNGPKGPDANNKDDVESFTYHATSGNLLTATNAVGHVTTYGDYDANGRPGFMRDPNLIYTRYVYDPLGRVKTITVEDPVSSAGNAVTSLDYDIEGRVSAMTLPSTETMTVEYDLAGRVTKVNASNNERIEYEYDAMSNVTLMQVQRTNGSSARTITSTFDSLGRMLTQTLGGARTRSWTYDANGNVQTSTGARSNTTINAFDALDRLVSSTAPDTGVENHVLDAQDRPTSFTDAKSVATTFVRNGFGEVIGETSPDRGSRTFYYDAAGDLVAGIDGRGRRVDYTRDALGRLTSKKPVGLQQT